MENHRENSTVFHSVSVFFRKLKLLRRIRKKNKQAKKAARKKIREREKNIRKWERRKRRRLIRFVLKKQFHKLFPPKSKKKTQEPVKIKEEQKRKQASYSSWKRRKRIIRFLIYKYLRSLSFGKKTGIQTQPASPAKFSRREKWIMMLNSASAFIIAYLTIQIISQALTLLIAQNFEFQGTIRYWGVLYFITSNDWTPDAVLTLYSVQPLTSLILSLIGLIIYLNVQQYEGILKMIFLWVYVYGLVAFFGALAVGTIINKGFGFVVIYIYLMDTAKLLISLCSLGALLFIGVLSRSLCINSANVYFEEINFRNVKYVIRYHIVYPALLGSLVIILFKLPKITPYELFTLSTIIIFLLPVWTSPGIMGERIFEDSGNLTLRRKMLIFSFSILVLFRLFTDPRLLASR